MEKEDVYNKPFSLKIWAKMLPFFYPYRKQVLAISLLMIVSATVDVALPLLQKAVIDYFIIPQTVDGIGIVALIGGIVLSVQVTSTLLFTRLAMKVEMSFSRDLKQAIFDQLQRLSLSYYNKTPVGYMLARLMSDTNRIGGLVAWGLVDFLWSILYVIFVIIAMLALEWRLAIAIVVMVPVLALITSWFQNKILYRSRQVRRINSQITGFYNEGIIGFKTSKTLVIEQINNDDFAALSANMRTQSVKAATLGAIYMPVIMFFGSIAVAVILVQGSNMAMANLIQLGTLSAMISYATGIFQPIQQMAKVFADTVATQANIERVSSLLDKETDITDSNIVTEIYGDSFSPKRENWEDLHGDITFDNVTFRYDDGVEDVLQNFTLHIPSGTSVAIVGETGAGKSTLVNLACRFFEPTSGRVLIDGKDYTERSQLWLHSNIGYVLQSPHLFSGTVRDNIRYGKLDATDEEILHAAKLVSADKVIAKLEKGLDSDVGEGGDRLSTGEKQLISFARAVISNPRIFVLDEATSSIDTDTEQLIQNAIANILKGRTSFLVAHRLSTIKMADLILVVKDGKIIEQGTHASLLNQKGYYLKLYTMQLSTQ